MTRPYGKFFGFIANSVHFAYRSEAAYRTLDVSEAASDAEIEQAYRRLIARYSPERLVGVAEPLRRQAEKKASEIDAAYNRIRTLRKRLVHRKPSSESLRSAMAKSEDRGAARISWWMALALIGLVTVTWLVPLRDQWTPPPPQVRMPVPDASAEDMPASVEDMPASVEDMPASPTVVAPPGRPSPVVATESAAPVEDLVVLMPKDPPPAQVAPSGEAALAEALRAGQLRPATGGDLSRWAIRWSAANGRSMPERFRERSAHMTAYMIQKDFTIPEGLNGAHAVIFLLDTRVPYPRGSSGHSVVLDLSTGSCMGVTCGMLLD